VKTPADQLKILLIYVYRRGNIPRLIIVRRDASSRAKVVNKRFFILVFFRFLQNDYFYILLESGDAKFNSESH